MGVPKQSDNCNMNGKLQIETKAIAELQAAPYNPRVISQEMLDALGASINRFGLVEPVVWNRRTGHVVGGHQRLKVLQAQGIMRRLPLALAP